MVDNINYNSNILCTYKKFEDEDDIANICYQAQLLQVFNMNNFDETKLENKIKNIYAILKNLEKITKLLDILSKEYKQFDLINQNLNNDDFNLCIFKILFSYEYFDIFHLDISNYLRTLNTNSINDNFTNIFNKIYSQ